MSVQRPKTKVFWERHKFSGNDWRQNYIKNIYQSCKIFKLSWLTKATLRGIVCVPAAIKMGVETMLNKSSK